MPMEHYTRTVWSCNYEGCIAHGETAEQRGLGGTDQPYRCHRVSVDSDEMQVPRYGVFCVKHWNELLEIYNRFGLREVKPRDSR